MKILTGAREFWGELEQDIRDARESIEVQAMSLEADAAGWALTRALLNARCARKRVIIDSYAKYIMGCRFIYSPAALADKVLRKKRRSFAKMMRVLAKAGVQVHFSNPAGAFLRRLPARNHKKTVIIDGRVSYFGGFNFTDHNYAWHDMMLRCEDNSIATALAQDFQATWSRRHRAVTASVPGLSLHTTDGRTNAQVFDRIFSRMATARREIMVHSPYVTFPFFEHLRRAARRGVRVSVITPSENTIGRISDYIRWESARSQFNLHLFPGMSHLKAMLIDDECLIAGSSNFDYLSYRLHQEVVAFVSDPAVIADFRLKVLEPDLHACSEARHEIRAGGSLVNLQVRSIALLLVAVSAL